MNNQINEVQSTIDEIKQNIPEGIYLKLCEQMKDLYTESKNAEAENAAGIYKINYELITIVQNGRDPLSVRIENRERLIELSDEEYESMRAALFQSSYITFNHPCLPIMNRLESFIERLYIIPSHKEIKELDFESDFPDDFEEIEEGIRNLSLKLLSRFTARLVNLTKC